MTNLITQPSKQYMEIIGGKRERGRGDLMCIPVSDLKQPIDLPMIYLYHDVNSPPAFLIVATTRLQKDNWIKMKATIGNEGTGNLEFVPLAGEDMEQISKLWDGSTVELIWDRFQCLD